MRKKISSIALFFIIAVICSTLTGCLEEQHLTPSETREHNSEISKAIPCILPDWKDGDYHDYEATTALLYAFTDKYPELVLLTSIGKSVQGKDIWCIRVTNEHNHDTKSSCVIDGCIHGCEWEAGEACLYLAEYLLLNYGRNTTISSLLNTSEIYIIPLVNPDGRNSDSRFNDNGIDLNRNFDVDFGRLRGHSIRLGKLFGRIKIPYIELGRVLRRFNIDLPFWGTFSNCGRYPFSEPESQAVKHLIERIGFNDISFYLNCHTAAHGLCQPWMVFKPPFEMTEQETDLFDHVLNWVEENSEYEALSALTYKGKKVYLSGSAQDWVYKECRVPSFSFEILSEDYEMYMGQGTHDNLVHWMQTTLPVFMYMLLNMDYLRQWKPPAIQPSLPAGIPPDPLK